MPVQGMYPVSILLCQVPKLLPLFHMPSMLRRCISKENLHSALTTGSIAPDALAEGGDVFGEFAVVERVVRKGGGGAARRGRLRRL